MSDTKWKRLDKEPFGSEVISEDGFYGAWVRSPGNPEDCIEFKRYYNTPGPHDDLDQIHVCDIDNLISILESLRDYLQGGI